MLSKKRASLSFVLGLLLSASVLTSPAMVFVNVPIIVVCLWQSAVRRNIAGLVLVTLGFALPMMWWQVNSFQLDGRFQWTVYAPGRVSSSGKLSWSRYWLTTQEEFEAIWFGDPDTVVAAVPPQALPVPVRELLRTRWKLLGDIFHEDAESDEQFRRMATNLAMNDTFGRSAARVLQRALSLWWTVPGIPKPKAGMAEPATYSAARAIYRAILLVLVCVTVIASLSKRAIPTAIIVGTVAYTFYCSYSPIGECRRDLVFIPYLTFLAYYAWERIEDVMRQHLLCGGAEPAMSEVRHR
jgi:hypothetical protein